MTPQPPWWLTPPTNHGEAWVRRHGDEVAVYDPDTETLTLMNPSAFAIWELCDGETSPEEMAQAVAELTGVDVDRAHSDLEKGLTDLAALGLVRLTPDQAQPKQ